MAEIIIDCPHCSSSMALEEEYLGMEFQCPVCNQKFIVERPDDAAEQDDLASESAAAPGTPEDADGSAASTKNNLENLFSNNKGKLGNLRAPGTKKPTSAFKKEYDEDYLPEPNPGYMDKNPAAVKFFKTPAIIALAVFIISVIVSCVMYNNAVSHNWSYLRILESCASMILERASEVDKEVLRSIGDSKTVGEIRSEIPEIRKSGKEIQKKSEESSYNEKDIKAAASAVRRAAKKMQGILDAYVNMNGESWEFTAVKEQVDDIINSAEGIGNLTSEIVFPFKVVLVILAAGLLAGAFIFTILTLIMRKREQTICRKRKRDLVREYFEAHPIENAGNALPWFFRIMSFIPFANIIFGIIYLLFCGGSRRRADEKFCRFREPIYDEVRDLDVEYLEKLNVLSRFGKNKQQLVSPMQTLFSPAFAGVKGLRKFQSVTSEIDGVYRYNLEEVTKIYTFEDQLFIYTGVWAYALGKMISEKTEAFFFKDITDMRTESVFRIHKKYEQQGCLSIFLPIRPPAPVETVYKESESFVLTAASGNSIGLNIGFEDSIRVTGATYTSRNDNEKIVHAIRKMIEEKKVAADA